MARAQTEGGLITWYFCTPIQSVTQYPPRQCSRSVAKSIGSGGRGERAASKLVVVRSHSLSRNKRTNCAAIPHRIGI